MSTALNITSPKLVKNAGGTVLALGRAVQRDQSALSRLKFERGS
jgi:hypothetical protein